MRIPIVRQFLLILAFTMAADALRADNVTGVKEEAARQVAEFLKPGQILLWNCPGCTAGAVVMRVRSVEYGHDGNSKDFAVRIRRDILIRSDQKYEKLSAAPCAAPESASQSEGAIPERDWTVDLTYTYFSKGRSGSWATLGSMIGVTNNPVPSIELGNAILANITRCAKVIDEREPRIGGARGPSSWTAGRSIEYLDAPRVSG